MDYLVNHARELLGLGSVNPDLNLRKFRSLRLVIEGIEGTCASSVHGPYQFEATCVIWVADTDGHIIYLRK